MTETTEKKRISEDETKKSTRDEDIEIMFHQLRGEDMMVSIDKLFKTIQAAGLIIERDQRLKEFYEKCCQIIEGGCFKDAKVECDAFYRLVESRKKLISSCITKKLKIEDFPEFSTVIDDLHLIQKSNISGQLSQEFPELGKVDVNRWGVAICSVDGQRKFAGDSSFRFTMQNLCKPLLLGLVLKTVGFKALKEYVAFEPNNVGKDVIELNAKGKALNSMVDTGAIILCALLTTLAYKGKSLSFIHETYFNYVKTLIAGEYLDFKASSYISKLESADELRCLCFGLKCSSVIPSGCDVSDSLDLFLKASSFEVTTESLSIIAATLANGGINPLTEERIFSTDDVKEILSAMYSYGLYHFSGESSFTIGVPMKSSTSGGLIMVVPQKMGVAMYSPLLNEYDISDRSYQFCKDLVNKMKLHNFDNACDMVLRKFPNRREKSYMCEPFCDLMTAAAANDVLKLSRLRDGNADFYATDFFGHTVLHVAAVKAAFEAVKFILTNYPSLATAKDRWDRTPKIYAEELKYYEIAKYLEHFVSLRPPEK